MLIVKIVAHGYGKEEEIDEIWIQNIGEQTEAGMDKYEIRKPRLKGLPTVYHKREWGWYPLVQETMRILFSYWDHDEKRFHE